MVENSLPRSFGWQEGPNSNAIGFESAYPFNRPLPEGLEGEEISPQIHFSSEMFEKRPLVGSFGVQTLQNELHGSLEWHREALQPSLNQNSCPFPQNRTYDPTLNFHANSCPVSFKDMAPEQPSSRPNRPVPRYDNSAMLKLAASCGLDTERLSVCYEKLERPEDFGDDSSYLGSWMNAAEAKNSLVAEVFMILIDAVKAHQTLLTGLSSGMEKQAGESAERQNSLELLSLRMEQMRGQLAEDGQLLVSRTTHELSQSFQGSLQALRDQASTQFEDIGRLVDSSQIHSEGLIKGLMGETRTHCENLVKSMAGDTQLRLEKLAKDTSEHATQQESAIKEKLRLLSGELASVARAKEAFNGCEGFLKMKVNEMDSKIEKVKQELSATSSSDLKRISDDLNLTKLRLEKIESSVSLAHSALQRKDVESILAGAGLDKPLTEVARLSKELLSCQNDIRTSRKEADRKLQEISASFNKTLQEESSKRSVELSDAIIALRRELSEMGEADQRDPESRLLACEGQLSEILNFQKDLKQELAKKATPSGKDTQKDPKLSLTASNLEKEFIHYKNLVDQHTISLKELGHELRVWRKECSLLVKRFEEFCPEGCLAPHKGVKSGGQGGKGPTSKGMAQTPKEPPKNSSKDTDLGNDKGHKVVDHLGPQNKRRRKTKSRNEETGKKPAKPTITKDPKTSSQKANAQREPSLEQTASHKPKGEKAANESKPKGKEKGKGAQGSQKSGEMKKGPSEKGLKGSRETGKISNRISDQTPDLNLGQKKNPVWVQKQGAPKKGKLKRTQAYSNPEPARWGALRYQAPPFFHGGYQLPSWGQTQPSRMGPYPGIHPTYLGQPAYPLVGYGSYPY